jgi:hypothetical protein
MTRGEMLMRNIPKKQDTLMEVTEVGTNMYDSDELP